MTASDGFVTQAREQTGLDDFGPETFREGLELYCDSAFSEASLNELGAAAVGATIVNSLCNRLRVRDWVNRHPGVNNEEIAAPVMVIGMFRAGTTLLSNLLDQDPANRCLLRWESSDSAPPPAVGNFRSGPRVDAARAEIEMLEQLNPNAVAIHHEDADGPTECIAVMSQDFKSLSWEAIANVPSYGSWLTEVDQESAYSYHRTVLQVLQSGGVRGRWTLKSPHHATALGALRRVYPDARLVVIHRDPVLLCASVFSLITTLSSTFSDADHTKYITAHWSDLLDISIARLETFRAAHPDQCIVDVRYNDLMSDPLGTVAGIYDAVGEPLRPQAEAAMASYLAAHPKGHRGDHRYDLAEFGVERGEIVERFSGYAERYAVGQES